MSLRRVATTILALMAIQSAPATVDQLWSSLLPQLTLVDRVVVRVGVDGP